MDGAFQVRYGQEYEWSNFDVVIQFYPWYNLIFSCFFVDQKYDHNDRI